MNQAENLKLEHIVSRAAVFIIYFTAAGLGGVLCAVIFNSFIQIAFRNNPVIKDIILYLISLLVIFAALCFFSMREGYTDTQNLRYSLSKTSISYIATGIIFFSMIVCLDIYVFRVTEWGNVFKSYFLQPYYADENIGNFRNLLFLRNNGGETGYVISGVIILAAVGVMIAGYKSGRSYWISKKKKRVDELRDINAGTKK